MPYSYTGNFPDQQLNNSGIFSPNDALNLKSHGEWGGSLELISTQTVSSVSEADFTNIFEDKYKIHFLQCNLTLSGSSNTLAVRLGNSSGIHTSGYARSNQYFATHGSFGEQRSTSTGSLADYGHTGNGDKCFYMYLYNAQSTSKYTFATNHAFGTHPTTDFIGYFGGGYYDTAEKTTQIRVYATAGTLSGTLNL